MPSSWGSRDACPLTVCRPFLAVLVVLAAAVEESTTAPAGSEDRVCKELPSAVLFNTNCTEGSGKEDHCSDLAFRVNGAFFIEHRDRGHEISGQPTWWTPDMEIEEGSAERGMFAYFCQGRLMLSLNSCAERNGNMCQKMTFQKIQHRLNDGTHGGHGEDCEGFARTARGAHAARIGGPWEVAATVSKGFLQGWTHEWVSANFTVTTSIAPCHVTISPWMEAAVDSSFCLGGWGKPRREGLCRPGWLLHPWSLDCRNGTLNLMTPPAGAETSSEEGWWCARPKDIGKIEGLDQLPPFYFLFFAGLLKMAFTLLAFGPPKPGSAKEATTFVEKAKRACKSCLQAAMLSITVFSFVTDMLEAWTLGISFWNPEEIQGYSTRFQPWGACMARFLGAASLVFINSGVVGSMASVLALQQLYEGHYTMEYLYEGERVLKKRAQEGNPVPVEKRYGIANSQALAGHEDFKGDLKKMIYENEGVVTHVYMTFVEGVLLPIYIASFCIFLFVGIVLYFWVLLPFVCVLFFCISEYLIKLVVYMGERKKTKQVAAADESSQGLCTHEEVLTELEDDDAVFYFILEFKGNLKELKFTEDVLFIFSDSEGQEAMSVAELKSSSASFEKDSTITAHDPLTYSALCRDPALPMKLIQVDWTAAQRGGEDKQMKLSGYVPVNAVVPTFDHEEARKLYMEQARAYRYTGTTTEAWKAYFTLPLQNAVFYPLAVTLGVRFVVLAFCWPLEMVPQTGLLGLWGAYMQALNQTWSDRTLARYISTVMESASATVKLVNLVL